MTIAGFTVPGEPPDEAVRLAVLQNFAVLRDPLPPEVEAIVAETARDFGVPITLVSIVTGEQQCFAARIGLEATATPRAISFCGHAVAASATLVVPDARQDPRFAGNPLVIGPPFIRFYAGAPLVAREGVAIGTLCVIDNVSHTLSNDDIARLEAQAGRIMEKLEAGRTGGLR